MIKYNLTCECKGIFDCWFSSSKEFDRQKKNKLVLCPECGSYKVEKSIMSPYLKSKSNSINKNKKIDKKIKKQIIDFNKFIKKHYKYVGDKFAQEARNIHYDKKTSKGIYGTASNEETKELAEEGIEVSTIPWIDKKEN